MQTPALVVEKDAVFIPAGWDNDKKISILYENLHSVRPDQYYTDVIARPMTGIGRKPQVGHGKLQRRNYYPIYCFKHIQSS